MRVIINADDFGYSTVVNEEITRLIRAGRVTSATIIANGPAFGDAISRIECLPDCSFGVHLNLTEFASLTQSQVFHDSGIVDDHGRFTKKIRSISPSPKIIRAVENEWAHQIDQFQSHGFSVSHVDSHHHVHTIPWLLIALKAVQKRFKIQKVRTTLNHYYTNEPSPSRMKLASKKIWCFALRRFYPTTTTDHFTSFNWFIPMIKEEDVHIDGVVELMCHPGQRWAATETALLWSDWEQLVPKRIRISYNDL